MSNGSIFSSEIFPASSIYHHRLASPFSCNQAYEWIEDNIPSFDEMILSWNAFRPLHGYYTFSLSLKLEDWSPWHLYAYWANQDQKSFEDKQEFSLQVFQDIATCLEGKTATGFKIRVEAHQGAILKDIFAFHACTTRLKDFCFQDKTGDSSFIDIPIPGISQLALAHPRHRSLCSPSSTAAVINYLTQKKMCPLKFAEKVHDSGFDIYGNWVLNTAQAFIELGPAWQCWVMRCVEWQQVIHQLHLGLPVVVSVKGSLPGAPLSYDNGHLIVIKGYDPQTKHILCMDPAFPTDDQTHVCYLWEDFILAWKRRGCIAYFFAPAQRLSFD
ncbi:C39 family peptidase [Candidatus Protochlamydia phocaeensis]|uniref:C39 family peptidase n=1 Tax=Candidatus Protochlamydia phocaeensis TaxID=1414722 RepID=UPI000A98986E|nr:C39 family peptidase [Candidatus Protochlamydia phocaeensis]